MDTNSLTQLYLHDLQAYPDLPIARKQELEELARQGDEQAKRELIESALRYTVRIAAFYAKAYGYLLKHDSFLDLVQEGNLALVRVFDKALTTESASAYIRGTVKVVIRQYCLYHSGMIRIPAHQAWIAKAPRIESMDAMIRDTELTYHDVLAAFSDIKDERSTSATSYQALYGPLHQALDTLPPRQREVVIRHFGLDGQEPETLYAISKRWGLKSNNTAWDYLKIAIKKLRKACVEIAEKEESY